MIHKHQYASEEACTIGGLSMFIDLQNAVYFYVAITYWDMPSMETLTTN